MTIEHISLDGVSDSDWLKMRHGYLGSSEVPILFGEGYSGQTMYDLWQRKGQPEPVIESDDDISLRMWLGRHGQQMIGEAIKRDTGWDIQPNRELIVDPDRGLCSTVDFRVHGMDIGRLILETKMRDYFSFKDRYVDGDACIYDRIQLATQMLLEPEIDYGVIGVLVGMSELKRYAYDRADLSDLMTDIERRVAGFWLSVDNGVAPPIEAADISKYMAANIDEMIEEENDQADLFGQEAMLTRYLKVNTARKAAQKIEDELKPKIIELMQDEDGNLHKFGWSKEHLVKLQTARMKGGTRVVKPHIRTTIEVARRDGGKA